MPGNFHAVPASVIAQWPKPNYVDPVRRSWLPAFSCTLLGVSTVLITARFYLRARREAGDFGLDDLFIFIAWLVSVGFSASAVIDSEWYGIDVHTWDVPPTEYVGAALTGWIAQVLFLVSTCATKASVLLFYRRMAKDSYSRKWLYAIWAALAFTAVYFVGVLITYFLICEPLDAYWLSYDFHYKEKFKCIDGNALTPISGVLSVVSDIYAVILPCVWLHHYNFNVSRRQRIGLDIVFGLGTIVAGCGVARTYYLWKINHTYDTSWTGYTLFVWSLLECHLAIIFACAPSLRAFLRRYLGEPLKSIRSSSNNRSKRRTLEFSQNASTLRDSVVPIDLESAKGETIIEHRVLTKQSHETMDMRSDSRPDTSRTSESSETVPTIKTAEDYEAYALKQLSRYGYQRGVTGEKMSSESTEQQYGSHTKELSWLDDDSVCKL